MHCRHHDPLKRYALVPSTASCRIGARNIIPGRFSIFDLLPMHDKSTIDVDGLTRHMFGAFRGKKKACSPPVVHNSRGRKAIRSSGRRENSGLTGDKLSLCVSYLCARR
jgi:hypothetical protein